VQLRSDRRYEFAITPVQLWERILAVDEYPTWWPWLRHFDGQALTAGDVWRCTVQPPLPYAVRFTVRIDEVEPARTVAATVGGDVRGTARLLIEPDHAGCTARLIADLGPDKHALRALSVAARPLVRFGHNWVLDTGARQFRSRSTRG
jgi:hypothetical protein